MDNPSDDWCEYLNSALFAMNTSLQNTIKKYSILHDVWSKSMLFTWSKKEAESGSIEKAMDDIAKADVDEYICNIVEK